MINNSLKYAKKDVAPVIRISSRIEVPEKISDKISVKKYCRINVEDNGVGFEQQYAEQILKANRIVMIACGTSWHAALVAEYIFEELCRTNVEVEYASEFRYRNPVINEGDVIIAVSQSGETADRWQIGHGTPLERLDRCTFDVRACTFGPDSYGLPANLM